MNYRSKINNNKISRLSKLFYWTSIVGIFLAFLILIGVLIIYLYPFKIVETKGDYKVTPKQVKAGSTLIYHAEYCKYYSMPAKISRMFVNDLVYYMPDTVTNFSKGCQKTDVILEVPKELPAGIYHITIRRTYKLFFREIVTEVNTENFEILE